VHTGLDIVPAKQKAKDLAERLARTEEQLQLIQRVTRYLVQDVALHEVLQGAVDLVGEFLRCDSCLVYLRDGGELVLCASTNPHPSEIGKLRLSLEEGLTGWVARERRLLAIANQSYKDPRFKFFAGLREDTFEAFLSAPIIARGEVVGVINAQHSRTHRHTGAEMELVKTVGEILGCALVLARLETEGNASHVELVRASIVAEKSRGEAH
jgi:uroporphyrinogen-III synthase